MCIRDRLGIDLERGRPGCPQDNGRHERMHKDIARELEPRVAEQAALDLWREEFNNERPHEALGMKRPCEVYEPSERKYRGTPEDLEYPGMESRRVSSQGMIKWKSAVYFIGASLRGWSVGLKAVKDGQWEVMFERLTLGRLDETTLSFQRADIRPLEAGVSDNNV